MDTAWRMVIVHGRLNLATFCALSATCRCLRTRCIRIITEFVRRTVIHKEDRKIRKLADWNHCLNPRQETIDGYAKFNWDALSPKPELPCSYDQGLGCMIRANASDRHEQCIHYYLRKPSSYDDQRVDQYWGMLFSVIHLFLFRPTALACPLSDLIVLSEGYKLFHEVSPELATAIFPSRPSDEIHRSAFLPDAESPPQNLDQLIGTLKRLHKRDPHEDNWSEFKEALIYKRQKTTD